MITISIPLLIVAGIIALFALTALYVLGRAHGRRAERDELWTDPTSDDAAGGGITAQLAGGGSGGGKRR